MGAISATLQRGPDTKWSTVVAATGTASPPALWPLTTATTITAAPPFCSENAYT